MLNTRKELLNFRVDTFSKGHLIATLKECAKLP
jgi:hypothetical protein